MLLVKSTARMLAALLLIVVAVAATENTEQYSPECLVFNNEESSPSDGVPICYADATNKYSIPLINDDAFMDGITKINRERLPERLVHAKGTGAFGYFEVTHDISHICKADFLKKVGKKTPVVLRLSTGGRERGSSDLLQDSRGYSVRFYTEEGNFDILGFHTEMYFYKDPLRFSTIVHGVKRTPASNLLDLNTFWDAVTLIPDSLNFFVRIFSDRGIPASYRNMPGHSIHTYQIENDSGDYHFVRFHFIPDAGVKTLNVQDAMTLGATDPDYAIRDLYEAINKGEFPSWTVSAQILTKADVKKIGPRCFDVTRLIRTDEFPLHPIGKIVLNKNAENFQNDIEKLALCPCNLVPGILGAPDKIFESRAQIYHDTQLYRLGKNHNKIPVNCPLRTIFTYNRDGMPPVGNNDGNAPNYYPNSFGGPQPYDKESYSNKTCKGSGLIKIIENKGVDNLDQVADFYNELTNEGRTILIENLKTPLLMVHDFIQKRACNIFTLIHPDFGSRLAKALNIQ